MAENDLFNQISNLDTEQNNRKTKMIDTASVREILELINDEDEQVPAAVRKEIPNIEIAVDKIVESFGNGGRLFYVGAGTSGRLGVVDASECPPTFGTSPDMVQGIIAGGPRAMFRAVEGAEDSPDLGANEIVKRGIMPPDVVCGIAASGRTPFVQGAIDEARLRGIFTILVTTANRQQAIEMNCNADCLICLEVGAEVIAGSTRMKSGTAQKLVLNMLTTASMIRLGKTYGNVMVDLQLTNSKLKERAKNIVMTVTGVDYETAESYLKHCSGHVKTALVMILSNVSSEEAAARLRSSDGFVRQAISTETKKKS